MTHTFKWVETSIGGFASCQDRGCGIINTEVEEKDCINYVSSEQAAEIEKKRKEKRNQEREIKKAATIKWLREHGKQPN